MSKQIAVWKATDTPGTGGTEFCSPLSSGQTFGTEAQQHSIVATPGTFRNMRVVLSAAPGGGNSWTVTLRVNNADTALTLTFTNPDTDLEITGVDVPVVAGDLVALEFTAISGPTTMSPSVSLEFESDTVGASTYGSCSNSNITIQRFQSLFGGPTGGNWTGTLGVNAIEGDLTRLDARLSGSTGTGTYEFVIEKNGVIQDGSGGTVNTVLVLTAPATTGSTTFSLSCSPGDLFRMRVTPAGLTTARLVSFGVELIADTPGQSNFIGNPNSNTNVTNTEFQSACGNGSASWSATEAPVQATVGTAFDLNFVAFSLATSPGSGGDGYTITIRKNGVSQGLSATIVDTATVGTGSGTVSFVAGDLINMQIAPLVTPGARAASWAFSQHIAEDTTQVLQFNDSGVNRPDRPMQYTPVAGPVAMIPATGWWTIPPKPIRRVPQTTSRTVKPLITIPPATVPTRSLQFNGTGVNLPDRSMQYTPVAGPVVVDIITSWLPRGARVLQRRVMARQSVYAKPPQPLDAAFRSDLPWWGPDPLRVPTRFFTARVLVIPENPNSAISWWPVVSTPVRRVPQVFSRIAAPPFVTTSPAPDLPWLLRGAPLIRPRYPVRNQLAMPVAGTAGATPDLPWLLRGLPLVRTEPRTRDVFAMPVEPPPQVQDLPWIQMPPVRVVPRAWAAQSQGGWFPQASRFPDWLPVVSERYREFAPVTATWVPPWDTVPVNPDQWCIELHYEMGLTPQLVDQIGIAPALIDQIGIAASLGNQENC